MLRRATAFALTLTFALAAEPSWAQDFEFAAPVITVPASSTGETTFVVGFTIEQIEGALAETAGFSMGVAHDPAVLEVESIDYGPGVISDEWGEPWAFQTNAHDDGWTCGVIYSFLGNWQFQFPVPTVAIEVTYRLKPTADLPATTALAWSNQIGSPTVDNVVIIGGTTLPVAFADGQVTVAPEAFLRGDMNGDGVIDLGDVFVAKDYLFLGGDTPSCLAALDSNGDGAIDVGDIVFELSYLFLDGDPMPEPFPACGPMPAGSELSCGESQCAP